MSVASIADAYKQCEAVTRARAQNFYYGIRLLPKEKRSALCAVYAFARRIDDVGDDGGSSTAKLAGLDNARRDLGSLGTRADDPVLVALADTASRYPIPPAAFGDVIDGVEMDVRGITYDTFSELLLYCRRVAGAIGRVSVAIFGSKDPAEADRLADALGVAMQLTNILRDIAEDLGRGRVYIPTEDLERFACDLRLQPPPEISRLIAFETNRARDRFTSGLRILPFLDSRSAACVGAMAGIYGRVLTRIERRPEEIFRSRVSLPAWEKGWVAAQSLVGASR